VLLVGYFCYNSIFFANPRGFATLTLVLVQTKCGPYGSTLALAETNESLSVDYTWLNTCMRKADQPDDD
jgi:hypothetical protein